MVGHVWDSLLRGDAQATREAEAAVVANGEWHGEMMKQTKDGREIVVDVRWTLLRDAQDRPRSILAIADDVTEKKALEAQLFRAQRIESIGTLAGGIAHDLNNVLAPIMMSIEMLEDIARDDDDRARLNTLRDECAAWSGPGQAGAVVRRGAWMASASRSTRVHIMRDLLKVMRDTFPKSIAARFSARLISGR